MCEDAKKEMEQLIQEIRTMLEEDADIKRLFIRKTGEGPQVEIAGVGKVSLEEAEKLVGKDVRWSRGDGGNKIVNGYDAKVSVGQQNKHIPETNEYKNALKKGQTKSIMYGDVNDIQKLLNDKAGMGSFIGINKERVDFGKVIGQYVDPNTGIVKETTIGIIHYGKKGAHIVPARPN